MKKQFLVKVAEFIFWLFFGWLLFLIRRKEIFNVWNYTRDSQKINNKHKKIVFWFFFFFTLLVNVFLIALVYFLIF